MILHIVLFIFILEIFIFPALFCYFMGRLVKAIEERE